MNVARVETWLTKAEIAGLCPEDLAKYVLAKRRYDARNRHKSEAAKARRPKRNRTLRREALRFQKKVEDKAKKSVG